jgi:GH43 family beta-xylosidase
MPGMNAIWAPELHVGTDGNWYVYFSADTPQKTNESHRMYVLRGPNSNVDPTDPASTFTFLGQVKNLPSQQWQIDGTVFTLNNQLYMVYSGWPLADQKDNESLQQLWIARMLNDYEADPAYQPVMISTPTYPWEMYPDPNPTVMINEGPAWLEFGSFQGIIFSASASWMPDYKLGILQYIGQDPMNINSWNKSPTPLLEDNPNGQGPFAPGHCSYPPPPPPPTCNRPVLIGLGL